MGRKDILDIFGYEKLLTLENLEAAGLLCQSTSKTFPQLCKTLRLYETPDQGEPTDISFAYVGYCPLRCVQATL